MRIFIEGFEEKESTIFHLEYWWDRFQKYWVIQVFDEYDRQMDCEVGIQKSFLNTQIDFYKTKWETESVVKL